MKKIIFSLFSAVLLTGCATQSISSLTERELQDGYTAHNFNNGLISFDIVPQLGAVTTEFKYLP